MSGMIEPGLHREKELTAMFDKAIRNAEYQILERDSLIATYRDQTKRLERYNDNLQEAVNELQERVDYLEQIIDEENWNGGGLL